MTRPKCSWGVFDRLSDDCAYRDFDSLAAMVRVSERGVQVNPSGDLVGGSAKEEPRSAFYGGVSFGRAVKMTRDGWPESLPAIESERLEAAGDPSDLRAVFDVAGGEVDMGRYLSGEPECMVDISLSAPRTPVVTVVTSIAALSNVSAGMLAQRAAMVAAVIEWARSSGVVVEIMGLTKNQMSRSSGKRGYLCYTVRIADSRGAYDPTVIAYACGHAGMVRRIRWGVQDGESENMRRAIGAGRGSSVTPTADDLPPSVRAGAVVMLPPVNESRGVVMADLLEAVRQAVDAAQVVTVKAGMGAAAK